MRPEMRIGGALPAGRKTSLSLMRAGIESRAAGDPAGRSIGEPSLSYGQQWTYRSVVLEGDILGGIQMPGVWGMISPVDRLVGAGIPSGGYNQAAAVKGRICM